MIAPETYQARVHHWILACFGAEIGADTQERNHRFIEEALELVQSNGCTKSEALQLVEYVFSREIGEPHQEVGGVMNTLAALCTASGLDMTQAAEDELARVWTKVEKIRAKQAAKPKHSPLPAAPAPDIGALVERLMDAARGLRSFYKPGAVELIPADIMEEAAAAIRALTPPADLEGGAA